MHPPDPLRLCTTCSLAPHYENCRDCLGFGQIASFPGGEQVWVPLMADMASTLRGSVTAHLRVPPDLLRACPVCGSTIEGAPAAARTA